MNFIQLIDRVNTIHKLILNESTGTPEQLAKKIGVSRSSLYNLIEDLKSHNAPIRYSRCRQTFYYTKEYHFSINYSISFMDNDSELRKFSGGYSSVHYFRQSNITFV